MSASRPHASGLDRLRQWEWWLIALLGVAMLAFGANVVNRSAFLKLRMTDADVFFRAGWAVRTGLDIYRPLSERDWHYVYPQFFAIVVAPLADPITPAQLEARGPRREEAARREAIRRGDDSGEFRARASAEIQRDLEELRPVVAGDRGWYVPYGVGVALWYVFGLGCVLLSADWLARAVTLTDPTLRLLGLDWRHRGWWTLRLWPLVFCLPGWGNGLSRGQVDALILLSIAGMAYGVALGTRRWRAGAGVWLALGACIKVIPALLVVYPLWRRDVRMTLACAAAGLAMLVVVPTTVLGPSAMWTNNVRWLQVMGLPGLGLGGDTSRKFELYGLADNDSQSLKATFHRWANPTLGRGERPDDPSAVVRFASIVASLGLVALACWCARWRAMARAGASAGDGGGAASGVLMVGVLAGIMVVASPVCHLHYFAFALPLVVAVVSRDMVRQATLGLSAGAMVLGLAYLGLHVVARVPRVDVAIQDSGVLTVAHLGLVGLGMMMLRRAG